MSTPLSRAAVRSALLRWFRIVDAVDGDEVGCQGALLGLIQWFDLTAHNAEPTTPAWQALTRAIAAAGRVLAARQAYDETHPVYETIVRADEHIRSQSDETYDSYYRAASNSFPYGSGEGCYQVPELGETCLAGGGCRTGAGSLYSVASRVGARAVVTAIRREVEPWAQWTQRPSLKEDGLAFPSAWIKDLHPRRGGVAVPLTMSADPAADAEALFRHVDYDVLYMCEHRSSSAGLGKGARAFRRGEADPLGAAAAAAAANSSLGRNSKHHVESVADGWVRTHGLSFAARACAELGGLAIDYESRHGGHTDYYVRTHGPSLNRHWRDSVPARRVIKRVRTHLAACSDEEYDEVCQALAEYRGHPRQRAVVSYLLPAQMAWVDEDCAAGGGGLLVYSLRTVQQLDGYLRSSDRYDPETAGDLATVLEGVGVAGIASVMRWAEQSTSIDHAQRERLVSQRSLLANAFGGHLKTHESGSQCAPRSPR